MKVLWLGGIVLPKIAEKEKMSIVHMNGWLIQISELLCKNSVELVYVFDSERKIAGTTECYSYYGIKCKRASSREFGEDYIQQAVDILKKEKPDIIHIWGTEGSHSLAMVEAAKRCALIDRTIISMQGLVSFCYYHYNAYLPANVIYRYTIRDVIKGNIASSQRAFRKRGEIEIKAIQNVNHVIGRTEWDRICAKLINPSAKYHHNNETLREEFYTGQIWTIDNCCRHSIFCSQSNYPIKGVHIAIEALSLIVKEFPDAHLYIGGKDYSKLPFYKLSSYGKYLIELIRKYKLSDNVTFTGYMSAEQMVDRYLKTHVFLSASSIENSPNSLGEAMLLGVPCIASNVGGVSSIFTSEVDGKMYPADEYYILAEYICEVFRDDSLAIKYSQNANKHAIETHDPIENLRKLIEIYSSLLWNES